MDLEEHKELLLVHPTGSGKSIIICELCNQYLEAYKRGSVLILTPYVEVENQLYKTCKIHGKHKVDLVREAGISHARIFVTTVQSSNFDSTINTIKNSIHDQVRLIIIDEAHVGHDWFDRVKKSFTEAKIVYFTATPYQKNMYAFPNIKLSHSISIQRMIDEGLLVKPKLCEILFPSKYFPEILAKTIQIYQEKEKNRLSVWYFNTKNQAVEARNACIAHGIKAEYIVSDHSKNYRNDILQKFRNKELQVIVNVNCLSAGFDCPPIESIFMPLGTDSITLWQQRIGRGLRPFSNKRECRIYVYGDTPTLKTGVYRRAMKIALQAKAGDNVPESSKDILNDLIWLEVNEDKNNEKIEWTRKTIEVCELLNSNGLENVSSLLRYKKFPQKYLANISELCDHIQQNINPDFSPLTEQQLEILLSKGFDKSIEKINKGEATSLIAIICSYENRHGYFSVQEGKYQGKHIKDLPGAYLGWLKKNTPGHPLLKLRWEWSQLAKMEGVQ